MKNHHGHLVLSLDFELFWGIFDVRSLDSYKQNLENVRIVIPRLLELCDTYNAKLSFATVGLLFAKSKEDILKFAPNLKPTYTDTSFSPYQYINTIGEIEEEDPYHYANSLLRMISENGNHEIASHSFSHYFTNEKGQDIKQFEEDLKANIKIAKQNSVEVKSFVFPRNQINKDYLAICTKHGMLSYRGTEKHWIYDTRNTQKLGSPLCRIMRLLDSYINITGHNTYCINAINKSKSIINIPSSKFLRPYSKKLSFLETAKITRINKSMAYAAKHNEVFHLWWHPHNFGINIDDNFEVLEQILKHYQKLNKEHSFESVTMKELATQVNTN